MATNEVSVDVVLEWFTEGELETLQNALWHLRQGVFRPAKVAGWLARCDARRAERGWPAFVPPVDWVI